MGKILRFLAMDEDCAQVLDWFRALPDAPEEIPTRGGIWLFFRKIGPLAHVAGSNPPLPDPKRSPLISFFPPRLRRGVLWTAGEVHFLATSMRQVFPRLHRVSQDFSEWLSEFPCVFKGSGSETEWGYYLEGSLKGFDTPIFALPRGMEALEKGQYFVSDYDTDYRLDVICKSLRHRGVEGITPA